MLTEPLASTIIDFLNLDYVCKQKHLNSMLHGDYGRYCHEKLSVAPKEVVVKLFMSF